MVHVGGPSEAQALGISTVFQDLALCDNLDVVANLFLGQEKGTAGWLDEVTMEKESWRLPRTLSPKILSASRSPRCPVASGRPCDRPQPRGRAEGEGADEPTAASASRRPRRSST